MNRLVRCWLAAGLLFSCGLSPGRFHVPGDLEQEGPSLLSGTGVFTDLRGTVAAPQLLPYSINHPFWSDGAAKRRWMALPDEATTGTIGFHPTEPWRFPAGTVFLKHFEFPVPEGDGAPQPVETRLLRVNPDGGVHGGTYRWRADGTDAELVRMETRAQLTRRDGSTQPWYFPGPADCRTCHNVQGGAILGVNTRQLNCPGPEEAGDQENQLVGWSRRGLLDRAIGEEETPSLPRLVSAEHPGAPLEDLARSYLDVNYAMCHHPGNPTGGHFDARFSTRLAAQNLVDGPVMINFGIDRARVLSPNDPDRSMIVRRLATHDAGVQMPPLGRELVDEAGVALMRRWVASYPAPPVVRAPKLVPEGGEFRGETEVQVIHNDREATVHYTLDGSPPGEKSPVYRGSIKLTRSTTVRARAYQTGHTRSIPVQATFTRVGD